MILLPNQLINPIIQIPYRMLPQSLILNLGHLITNLTNDLLTVSLRIGTMFALGGEVGSFLTVGE